MSIKPLTDEQIKEIAEDIDIGFICYLNKQTHEYRFLMNDEYMDDEELWEEAINEVESWEEVVKIEKPSSHDSFKFMEEFAESLPEGLKIKDKLLSALERRKPFRNFKDEIDDEGDPIRQEWFDFKAKKMQDWVR